jgi:DNA-binding response OmpR family regulator
MSARVKAIIRRTETNKVAADENTLISEDLKIDLTAKKVFLHGEEVYFTKKEFEVLMLFLKNKNKVLSREDILSRVWTNEVFVLDRTIDVNITRIRKKIGRYGKNIVTRQGYGYCFEE